MTTTLKYALFFFEGGNCSYIFLNVNNKINKNKNHSTNNRETIIFHWSAPHIHCSHELLCSPTNIITVVLYTVQTLFFVFGFVYLSLRNVPNTSKTTISYILLKKKNVCF